METKRRPTPLFGVKLMRDGMEEMRARANRRPRPHRNEASDPYVETATANPERVNNGCQIYRRSA